MKKSKSRVPGNNPLEINLLRRALQVQFGRKKFKLIKRRELFNNSPWNALFNPYNLAVCYFHEDMTILLKKLETPHNFKSLHQLHATFSKKFSTRSKNQQHTHHETFWSMLHDLFKKNFLIPHKKKEDAFLRVYRKNMTKEHVASQLKILPGLNCNYRCRYCYHFKRTKTNHLANEILSWENAKRGIDWFFKNLDASHGIHKQIKFQGGEPLLHYELIFKTLDYISKKNADKRWRSFSFSYFITTNASLVDKKWICLLKKYNFSVTVSLDGRPHLNDMMRLCRDNNSAAEKTLDGIKLLNKHGITPQIGIVIGPHNADHLAKEIRWINSNFKIARFQYNLAVPFYSSKSRANTTKYIVTSLEDAFDKLSSWGLVDKVFYPRWNSFFHPRFLHNSCAATYSQIVLFPDGQVGPCHRLANDNNQKETLNPARLVKRGHLWKKWRSLNHYFSNDCLYKCNYFGICGGTCPYQNQIESGSLSLPNKRECSIKKMLIRKAVWRHFNLIHMTS
ncbi:MAG: radical SAM protein [Deltaproteobacteria bacterium]|nr:radical SAM protein [Deltaproteobacteria bacterium]